MPREVTYTLEIGVSVEQVFEDGAGYIPAEQADLDQIISEAETILLEAPAFDWVTDEMFANLELSHISPDGPQTTLSGRKATVSTVTSGTLHKWTFTLTDEKKALCDDFYQGGESYKLSKSDVPEFVIEEMAREGYQVVEG